MDRQVLPAAEWAYRAIRSAIPRGEFASGRSLLDDQRMARTHRQHREIIAALKSRNPEWAQAQMTAHVISLVLPANLNPAQGVP